MFAYIIDPSFQYKRTANIVEVVFDISRYGRHVHTLRTSPRMTVKEAIKHVEDYLNVPMTDEYFESIKDDLFPGTTLESLKVRGHALGDCRFLETIETVKVEGGKRLILGCGS